MHHLKFPIGEYEAPDVITAKHREHWINDLAELPYLLKGIVLRMTEDHLQKRYRPDGWTGAQVIHHIADSHLNCYIRYKWALTEDHPTIKPYNEKLWAELPDGKEIDIEGSVLLIEQVQSRLVKMLRNMRSSDWKRSFHHPESGQDVVLDWNLGMYAWHGKHHLAHLALILD